MTAFNFAQIAAAVYLGAVLAAASVLGVMKFDADEKAGRPRKAHHLYPMIIGLVGALLALIGASG